MKPLDFFLGSINATYDLKIVKNLIAIGKTIPSIHVPSSQAPLGLQGISS